ncbi:MAG: polysaccharide deacetylase family protein, partial [Pseudoclavibacter sp.]
RGVRAHHRDPGVRLVSGGEGTGAGTVPRLRRFVRAGLRDTGTRDAGSRSAGTRVAGVRLGVAVALVGGLLAGCAPAPDPSWEPEPLLPEIVVDDETNTIDPTSIPGATGQRLRASDPNVAARWTALPGKTAMNDLIEDEVRGAIDTFVAEHGSAPYAPVAQPEGSGFDDRGCIPGTSALDAAELLADDRFAAADSSTPGLVITGVVVLAAGSIVGPRLRIVEGSDAGVTSDRTETIVSDTATGETGTIADLLAPEAREALWDAAVTAARHRAGALWDVEIATPDEATLESFVGGLTALSLDPSGGIAAVAPNGVDAPEVAGLEHPEAAAERFSFRVPSEDAADLLGPLGVRAIEAAASDEEYAGPAPVEAGQEAYDCSLVACVALTFDDGPDSTLPELLDHLGDAHAAATFFVLGNKVAGGAAELQQVLDTGNEIGNHSNTHIDFGAVAVPQPPEPTSTPGPDGTPTPLPPVPYDPDADVKTMCGEIDACTSAIDAAVGVTTALFRPPYGSYDDRIFSATSMPVILWDVDTLDWEGPGVDVVIERAVGESVAGSIVLMHSTHQSSIDATPGVLEGLSERGVQVVTVTQVFNGDVPSGAVRSVNG